MLDFNLIQILTYSCYYLGMGGGFVFGKLFVNFNREIGLLQVKLLCFYIGNKVSVKSAATA